MVDKSFQANNMQQRVIHFYSLSHKRDEIFVDEHSNKIAPVFTNTEIGSEPEKCFQELRDYAA